MADLCYRFKNYRYECLISPDAVAWHEMEMAGNRRNILYIYYILRNRFLFIKRCKKRFYIPLYVLWVIISCAFGVRSLVGGRVQTSRAIFLALRDGLTGRYGGRNYLFGQVDNDN